MKNSVLPSSSLFPSPLFNFLFLTHVLDAFKDKENAGILCVVTPQTFSSFDNLIDQLNVYFTDLISQSINPNSTCFPLSISYQYYKWDIIHQVTTATINNNTKKKQIQKKQITQKLNLPKEWFQYSNDVSTPTIPLTLNPNHCCLTRLGNPFAPQTTCGSPPLTIH